MEIKRVNVYVVVKPSNIKFNENYTLHHDIKAVDLSIEMIHDMLVEGQVVSEWLPDNTEEFLTLENYADENLYQAVEERRVIEKQLIDDHQDYEKEKYLEFRQKKQEGTIDIKQYESEMYADFEIKRKELQDRIQYLRDNTRGVVVE